MVVIPVFLLWLYVIWLIILFGAELCCYFQYKSLKIPYHFHTEERLDPMIVMDIVESLAATQNSPKGGLSLTGIVGLLKVPVKEVLRHLEFLQREGWVITAESNFLTAHKFFLTVPPEKIDELKIFKQLEGGRYIPSSARVREAQTSYDDFWTNWATRHPFKMSKAQPQPKAQSSGANVHDPLN